MPDRRISGTMCQFVFGRQTMFGLGRPESELLEHDWRSADPLGLDVNRHFDAVRNFHKRNTLIHSVVFAIEGHGSDDCAFTLSNAGNSQVQRFGFGDSADGEGARNIKSVGSSLRDSRRLE